MSQSSTILLHVSVLAAHLTACRAVIEAVRNSQKIDGLRSLLNRVDREVAGIAGERRRESEARTRAERAAVRPPGIRAAVAAGADRRRSGRAAATVRSTVGRAHLARRASDPPAGRRR
jgi:hypothetical protein